jgi:hypothetical protein
MTTNDASALSAIVFMMLVLAAVLRGVAVTDLMLSMARFNPLLLRPDDSTYNTAHHSTAQRSTGQHSMITW